MQNELLDQFRDSARDLLGRADQRRRTRQLRDQPHGFDRAVWQEIAAAGWLSILVPEADGGLGLGLAEVAAVAEIIGQELFPEPFAGAGVQVLVALCAAPAGAQRSRLLAQASNGELIAGLAWQDTVGELGPSDWSSALTATPAGDGLVLNGAKLFVCPGAGADGWLVLANDAGSARLVWVPKDTPGVACVDTVRIDGSRFSRIAFTEVRVPPASMLASGPDAVKAVERANANARIAAGAELLGVARQALAITLDYMRTRVQFGKPIGSFQALQHRAVDACIQVELAAAGLALALKNIDQAAPSDSDVVLAAAASRVKARCTEAALHVTQFSVQMHGAVGFTDECDIGLYYKRALNLGSWLGNAAAHRVRYVEAAGLEAISAGDDDACAADAGNAPAATDFPRHADWDAMPETQFRQLVRAFFRQHYPQQLRHLPRRLHWPEIKDWYTTLSAQGWIAPAWPRAFGGMGLSADKHLACIEEQERYGVARMIDAGLTMAGPLLIRYGTPEQQQTYLPKILSGEHIWSQGYSEPNAGSDLAALRTEAVLDTDGEHFIVNGQKTWTTMAQDSTHIFMLVRTDRSGKPQAGISFLLVDIRTPGITVRPIKDLVGHEHFCEVFFDNVRVPKDGLIGEMNQGWSIAKALLGFERIFLGSPRQSQNALAKLHEFGRANGLFDKPVFVDQYARLLLDVDDLSALYATYADMVKRGESLPASVSQLKIWATETYRRIGIVLTEVGQEYGGSHPVDSIGDTNDNLVTPLINSASATVYGGSNEIQRNILAKTVLDLPG
jgi:alkylation response protein AidB-like acyl-CoA dehydrogenase